MADRLDKLKGWAQTKKRDVYAVWLAARDARTPKLAKLIALATAAYAISPIDLIPDFIPVLGLIDDLLIVPLGIVLVIKLVPAELMREFRVAATTLGQRPRSRVAICIVLSVWAVCLLMAAIYIYQNT